MVIFQFALLAFGVIGGLLFAYRLRRQPWSTISRSRAVIAFGGGVAAWIAFAAIALPAPFSWVVRRNSPSAVFADADSDR
jgi:hypothetical protein